MPDTEEAEPATGRNKSLSTAVDEETYDWFVQHAKDNFRDRSGQLAYILAEYRKCIETQERIRSGEADPTEFGRALLENLADQRRVPRPIRAASPYAGPAERPYPGTPVIGDPAPGVSVTWEEGGERHQSQPAAGQAAWPDPADEPALAPEPDDDPDEGVA